ncbi:MAG TPA: radical SAM family heme chaperone HemW [Frankiaceae bacterium]|nr:radical SAM family heme chaperone HemW [Frankiaceae bacterium]
MPSRPPDGEPAPADGSLPEQALVGAAGRDLGLYLHVPFCATRCGYCDFNTYTFTELGSPSTGTTASTGPVGGPRDWLAAVLAELRLATRVLGPAVRPLSTVFIGGGTPTLLEPDVLPTILEAVRAEFGLQPDAEVTTEANPESTDVEKLDRFVAAGVNRISFGMQSAVPHVLRSLDRRHTPGRVAAAVAEARSAGIGQVSLDLIYGGPGETDDDWAASVDEAIRLQPDHVSAYALVVEDGTRLARQVRRGEVTPVDDDELADRYELADEKLRAAAYRWYEVSNWSRGPTSACRHNLGYWRGTDWWGLGPGAHSHVGGVRWWNVRPPAGYAARLAAGISPAEAREVLDPGTRAVEDVLLRTRLAEGLPLAGLTEAARVTARRQAADGLLEPAALDGGRAVLTRRGRLLADAVVRDLVD